MGQRQSVPPGRPKPYAATGYVTTTEGGLVPGVGRGVSFAAQPGPNAGLVVGYPGPVTHTAPPTFARSPANVQGYPQPAYPRRPAPAPPVSLHRPAAMPLPPSAMTAQYPAQRPPPMTTQPTSSVLNVYPGAMTRERTVVNSTGISPVGSDNGSATSSSAAAVGGGGEVGGGMLEALHAISMSSPFSLFADLKCPVCHKTIPTDNIELHLLQCLTKPEIVYNEDVLLANKGECSICFDELEKGNKIARLPCLCVYHKSCIDDWFTVSRCCPEHPDN